MNRFKLLVVTLFLLLAISSCIYHGHYVFAQTDQTSSKLQAANIAVDQAFNAVLDAETVGANVTNLMSPLNNAAGILAQAENTYRTGNSNTAAAQADSVIPIANQVATLAYDARQTALVSSQNTFWYTIAFTVIGIFIFVLALFFVWRWFKRSYISNLYKAKPEVTN
jgi:CHASE3 domain sensor protein